LPSSIEGKVALPKLCEDDADREGCDRESSGAGKAESEVTTTMNSKTKFALGVLTALAMLALTFAIPRGGPLQEAQLVQFPVTVGVWAIFVLLFVKLK
jgi:hypothetical protein